MVSAKSDKIRLKINKNSPYNLFSTQKSNKLP